MRTEHHSVVKGDVKNAQGVSIFWEATDGVLDYAGGMTDGPVKPGDSTSLTITPTVSWMNVRVDSEFVKGPETFLYCSSTLDLPTMRVVTVYDGQALGRVEILADFSATVSSSRLPIFITGTAEGSPIDDHEILAVTPGSLMALAPLDMSPARFFPSLTPRIAYFGPVFELFTRPPLQVNPVIAKAAAGLVGGVPPAGKTPIVVHAGKAPVAVPLIGKAPIVVPLTAGDWWKAIPLWARKAMAKTLWSAVCGAGIALVGVEVAGGWAIANAALWSADIAGGVEIIDHSPDVWWGDGPPDVPPIIPELPVDAGAGGGGGVGGGGGGGDGGGPAPGGGPTVPIEDPAVPND